jgi:gas vesicle protein
MDMADNNGDFGAFVTGFLFGGLVGAAVALLMAPQSGEETREIIRVKSIELKDQVEDAAEDAIEKVEKAADDARARAEELAGEARTRAEDLQKRGQVILDDQKTRIEKAIESGKKAAKQKRDEITGEA